MAECDCGEYTAEYCSNNGGTPANADTCSVYSEWKKENAGYKDKDKDAAKSPEEEENEMRKKKYSSTRVEWNVSIEAATLNVSADTGAKKIVIEGIAFHSGKNKNNWELSRQAAELVVQQMIGTDVTLNHPKPDALGFSRNMDGGVDEATVGVITNATIADTEDGYEVRYTAEIYRSELFEALETGLWMRPEYGVSIGGFGVPDEINSETGYTLFHSDFTLDHLAIVHRPAYERANIDNVVTVELEEELVASTEGFIPDTALSEDCVTAEAAEMTDEIDTSEMDALRAELEAAQASLILANADIERREGLEAASAEADRQVLVEKATELGLKGHEGLSSEVVASLIESWEASNPPAPEVVMEEATPAVASEVTPTPAATEKVVANYLNGKEVSSPINVYARAWNAWAKAYNGGISPADERAPMFEDLDMNQVDWLNIKGE